MHNREKLRSDSAMPQRFRCECTKFGQGAVDGVHSIENTRVAGGDFSLTKKLEGVEQ